LIASPSGREQSIFGESQAGDAHTEVAAERDLYGLGGSAQIVSDVRTSSRASPSAPMSMKRNSLFSFEKSQSESTNGAFAIAGASKPYLAHHVLVLPSLPL
jgi:hypothetical protein